MWLSEVTVCITYLNIKILARGFQWRNRKSLFWFFFPQHFLKCLWEADFAGKQEKVACLQSCATNQERKILVPSHMQLDRTASIVNEPRWSQKAKDWKGSYLKSRKAGISNKWKMILFSFILFLNCKCCSTVHCYWIQLVLKV